MPRRFKPRDERRLNRDLSLEWTLKRFQFSENDLADLRLSRLISRKITLDTQIKHLLAEGHRERRLTRFAKICGFNDEELACDKRLLKLIASIFDSRRYIASLAPEKTKPATPETPAPGVSSNAG